LDYLEPLTRLIGVIRATHTEKKISHHL
jgi:hypothetical protein